MPRNFDFFPPLQKLLGVDVYTRPLLGPPLVESCCTELCNTREAELNPFSVTVLDKYVSCNCIVGAWLSGGLTPCMEMQLAAIPEILDPAYI
jgi:hypothetical protein